MSLQVDHDKAAELEREFDAEMRFRPLGISGTWIVGGLLLSLSFFHFYTAGFGLLREQTHRGIHMALVLGLIFLVFAANRKAVPSTGPAWWRPGGVPIYDWALFAAAVVSSLYLPWIFHDIAFKTGNPDTIDVVMGTVLTLIVIEATRRTMGWALVLITLGFVVYAFSGPWMPGMLVHPGTTWSQLADHLYLTSQGIYGVPIGVVATYVFHFVLFGVVAMRIGLGRLFLAMAMAVAGRFAGGPAKVAIFGSALFGMISGSSVANAVTVGSLTIPMMKRLGYRPHFAARRRGDGQHRRPDHAAGHGRGGLPDGRVPGDALPDHHHRRDRAGLPAFLRRVHPGPLRGQARRPARAARPRRCPTGAPSCARTG